MADYCETEKEKERKCERVTEIAPILSELGNALADG